MNLRIDAIGERERILVDVGDLLEHRLARRALAVARHQRRIAQVRVDAEEAREDDDEHQREGERVQVPADLESGVQQHDEDQRRAEIDVRRQPAAQRARAVEIATLAHAEQHEPHDQQCAYRAQRVAEPCAAVRRAARIVPEIRRQRRTGQRDADPQVARPRIAQDGVMAGHRAQPSSGSRNGS